MQSLGTGAQEKSLSAESLATGSRALGGPVHFIVVGLLLVFCLVLSLRVVSDDRPSPDGRQNLELAYNIFTLGAFSYTRQGASQPRATGKRGPAYPVLLAGAFWLLIGDQPKSIACLLEPDPDCDEFLKRLKMVNVALMVLLASLTYLAAATLFGTGWVSVCALALFVAHTGLYRIVDNFLTEIPAALFLLAHAYFTYRLVKAPTRNRWAVLSGLALSLLVLTKAIFIFYPVAILALLLGGRLLFREHSFAAFKGMLVVCVIALVTIGLWTARNVMVLRADESTDRGARVLTIRAEHSTMSLPEYTGAIVFFTPYYGEWLAQKYLEPERYELLDPDNPKGYQQRQMNDDGVVGARLRRYSQKTRIAKIRAALSVLAENWAMHLALTPVFAYRGAGIPAPYIQSIGFEPLAKSMMTFSRFISLLFYPALLFVLVAAVRRRNWNDLLFFLPAFYCVTAYAILTHYIPRFSLPLVPQFVLALVWTVQAIVSRPGSRPIRG